jgi:hypothetical protein
LRILYLNPLATSKKSTACGIYSIQTHAGGFFDPGNGIFADINFAPSDPLSVKFDCKQSAFQTQAVLAGIKFAGLFRKPDDDRHILNP